MNVRGIAIDQPFLVVEPLNCFDCRLTNDLNAAKPVYDLRQHFNGRPPRIHIPGHASTGATSGIAPIIALTTERLSPANKVTGRHRKIASAVGISCSVPELNLRIRDEAHVVGELFSMLAQNAEQPCYPQV